MTLNDAILEATGGPTVNDGLLAFFIAGGATGPTLPDAERQWLCIQLSVPVSVNATNQDLWMQRLASYPGALNDKLFQFWSTPSPTNPVQALFENGEQGAWYDPSDFSTMFQDSKGTTPVTAVEQPVGLILDKRLGAVRGVERGWDSSLTPADFKNTAGYTITDLGDRIRITCTSATSGPYVETPLAVVAGSHHEVKITILSISTGAEGFYAATNGGAEQAIDNRYKAVAGSFSEIPKLSGNGNGKLRISLAPARLSNPNNAQPGDYIEVSKTISVREIPGNHASQPTAASRPVLSARKNLLTKTEDFADAEWIKLNLTVVANAATAPDGTMSADRIVETAVNDIHVVYQSAAAPGAVHGSIYVKAGERSKIGFGSQGGLVINAKFDLAAGTFITNPSNHVTATSVGNGWWRLSVNNLSGTMVGPYVYILDDTGAASYLGNVAKGVYVWGGQLEAGNQVTTYQRVNTDTDYDTVGFPHYLKFDGVDDSLSTGSIDFTSTDKMTVVAGYVAPSTALGMFLELSGNGNATDGGFYITDNEAVSGLGTYRNRGTTLAHEANLLSPTPDSGVITVRFDNGAALADQARIRINGADAPVVNGAATLAGNFGNHPLYIGSRAGTAFFFNGHLYSLVVRGAMTADLAPVETYVADKTGVVLP